MYFQEPRNIMAYIKGSNNPITSAGTDSVAIKFYGFNQEKDNNNYLFVGYDIYYYFPNSSNKRKASIQYPVVPANTNIISFPGTDTMRFPVSSFPASMSNFYEIVSLPVTIAMIENNLKQGSNDNVRFTFEKKELADNTTYPKNGGISGEAGDYIYLRSVFPAYYEYKDKTWGSLDSNFAGFYDIDYYHNIGVLPVTGNPDGTEDCIYHVYFYIVAKGFNSDFERTQNFVESISSSVVEVYFKALKTTRTLP